MKINTELQSVRSVCRAHPTLDEVVGKEESQWGQQNHTLEILSKQELYNDGTSSVSDLELNNVWQVWKGKTENELLVQYINKLFMIFLLAAHEAPLW